MAKTNVIETIMDGVDKNLPAMLTALGLTTGGATVGYSIYAGWKLRDEFSEKDVEPKERAKRVAKITAPVIGGAVLSGALVIMANKEYGSRCAALAAACAAGNPDVREKIAETVGIDRKKMDKKDAEDVMAKAKMNHTENNEVVMHDLETGMIFKTNLVDFWAAVNQFNVTYSSQFGYQPISKFYSILFETNEYEGKIDAHERKCFGPDMQLDPVIDVELGPNWEPRYTIQYDYRGGECD